MQPMMPRAPIPGPPNQGGQGKQQIRSLKENTTEIKCSCGCLLFRQGVYLRSLSRLLTGEEKDSLITIPIFFCQKCGQILEDYLPDELKTPKLV